MPLRLAVVQRYFPHYRKPVFDGLAARPDIRLTLLCQMLDRAKPEAGISQPAEDAPYVVSVRNRYLAGSRLLWQGGAVRHVLGGQCDVAILEGDMHILSNLVLLLAARLKGVPVLLWLKGWWGGDAGEASLGRGLRGWLRRRFLGLADGLVCYGETTRRQFLAAGLPPGRVFVAQNTVLVDPLLERRREPERAAVFTIGRMTRDKKTALLVQAFIAADLEGAELVVAGDGPARAEVLALAEGRADIRVTGPVGEDEAEAMFLGGAVCAFPGAVGLALNQAMAAGAAVLCADEPGPDSELVIDGVNGLRLPAGDPAAWADALRRLLGDEGLRRRLGEAARRTVQDRATISRMVDGLAQAAVQTAERR